MSLAENLDDGGTESMAVTSAISLEDGGVVRDGSFATPSPVVVITKTPRSIIHKNRDLEQLSGPPVHRTSAYGGIQYMVKAVELLRATGIVCCMLYEPALVYYGARRAITECVLCIPTGHAERASQVFNEHTSVYEPSRHPDAVRPDSLDNFFPRFKVRNLAIFFTIMPAQALNIACTAEAIEFSSNGIPYPKLHVYAQSLLDTYNLVDLVDLIDGMDLSVEWGETNLNLEGHIDVAWGRWAADLKFGGQAPPEHVPNWCHEPPMRRTIWSEKASSERKQASRGFKALPGYVTRFRRHGSPDPRLLERKFC